MRKYYTEQTMESIARRVLDAYDERLYRGQPRAIPIEDLIERHGLILEFQYLRKNGRILGKTVLTPAWRPCTTWNWASISCSR